MDTCNMDFETALKQLEATARKLESNDISLEESVKLFENGVELAKICSEKLASAKQKITLLSETESGDDVDD